MELITYEHKAQYYETDQMGIIHHSNYIRWFEEARVDLMDKLGLGYDAMESKDVVSPVLAVESQFKSMTRFKDIVIITTKVSEYNGVKLILSYTISDKDSGVIRCTGSTKHCFLTKENKIISLKNVFPEFHQKLLDYKALGKE